MTSPRVLQKMGLTFGTVVQELQATVLELDTLGKIIHKKNELLQAQTAEIEHQREEIKQLREALEGMLLMFEKVSDKINWGHSFLNAEAIRLMNEKPIEARAVLQKGSE